MNEAPNTAKTESLLVVRNASGKIISVIEKSESAFKVYSTEFSTLDDVENLFFGIMKTSPNSEKKPYEKTKTDGSN